MMPEVSNKKSIPIRFFVVTFLWSWLLWLPFVLGGLGIWDWDENLRSNLSMPAIILGAFGPGIAAIYSIKTLQGKSAVRPFLRSFLSVKFGWNVWLFIFGAIGLVNFLAWYLPGFFGYERLPMLLPTIFVFPIYWMIMVFFGGGQEEIGWRGYIMPYLESRYGIWLGNIILGIIWTLWHAPLWFIPDSFQVFMPFLAFLIGCMDYPFSFPG